MKKSSTQNIKIDYSGLSDVGVVRNENQDSMGQFPASSLDIYQPGGLLFIVADGMGGHANGQEASQMAVRVTSEEYYAGTGDKIDKVLAGAVQSANNSIFQKSALSQDKNQMGSTISLLAIMDDLAHIAHVGDSRIYLIRDKQLRQLTTDHTKVEDLKRAGLLNKEDAKNHPEKSVLNRALGIKEHVRVDVSTNIPIQAGDIFVLCSDGIAQVTKNEILSITSEEQPPEACIKIISLANDRGGEDNSTIQVVRVETVAEEKTSGKKVKLSGQKIYLYGLGILTFVFILMTLYISNDYRRTKSVSRGNVVIQNQIDAGEIVELFEKAQLYLKSQRYEEAVQTYQQVLMINPLDNDALAELDKIAAYYVSQGENFSRRGEKDQALKYYRLAFEMRPNNTQIKNIISELEEY
jgi:serine/threonine protein phosphatase PrpC